MEMVGKHFVLVNADHRKGGLSTVRRGVDTRDGSSVAVKFVDGPTDGLSRKVSSEKLEPFETSVTPTSSSSGILGLTKTGPTIWYSIGLTTTSLTC